MKTYKFKGVFRNYQQRVLDNSAKFLDDNHIHIVAAPGSGKTILGLELICRLGEKALILSPSLTIRNQWKDRFVESFVSYIKEDEDPNIGDIISTSLNDIKKITSITYQSLYMAFNKLKQDGKDLEDYHNFELITTIRKSGIKTICLDEAHHLRLEWQRVLEKFLKELGNDYKIIALTATPPYDASKTEWDRYIGVCGEIDEEISVAELVKEGNLCCHQDYIYFNYPTKEEINIINKVDKKLYDFLKELKDENLLFRLAKENKRFLKEENLLDICFDDEEYYTGFLRILEDTNQEISFDIRQMFLSKYKYIRAKKADIEKGFIFIQNHTELFAQDLHNLVMSKLSKYGYLHKNKINITHNKHLKKSTIQSVAKLNSIKEICISEYNNLSNQLRMLILGDYIKKDFLSEVGKDSDLRQIGIIPIFETIRRGLGKKVKIGVLTGSLIILPKGTLEDDFLDEKTLIDDYLIYEGFSNSDQMVDLVTNAFNMGRLEILIATKSLLGEGWDCPSINSLILASFVGSYVLSNQMRGRAIRTDPSNLNKTANIWHLATIEPSSIYKSENASSIYASDGSFLFNSLDFSTLERRFKNFIGPHYLSPLIESGINRIDINRSFSLKKDIYGFNKRTLEFATNREFMRLQWERALENVTDNNIYNSFELRKSIVINIKDNKNLRSLEIIFRNYLFSIFMALNLIVDFFLIKSVNISKFFISVPYKMNLFVILFNLYIAFLIKKQVFIARIMSPKKRLKIQADAILETYRKMGLINNENAFVYVYNKDLEDEFEISLLGGSIYEKEIFSKALEEIASPIERQKYIFVHNMKGFNLFYFLASPCPELIARNRESVDYLQKQLKRRKIPYHILYTRNVIGRKKLLKIRKLSLRNINTLLTNIVDALNIN